MTFDQATRSAIAHRSQGNCEARTEHCWGHASVVHHRQLRRYGNHTEVNAMHVCVPCHERIHKMGGQAYYLGWLVSGWDDPASIPVRKVSL